MQGKVWYSMVWHEVVGFDMIGVVDENLGLGLEMDGWMGMFDISMQ